MSEIIQEDQSASRGAGRQSIDEKLREIFNPYDMVGVKNVTNMSLDIPYLPSKNEKIISNQITKRVYGREEISEDGATITPGKRETLRIGAGEVAVISGEFAYVVIPTIINVQLQLDARKKPQRNSETGTSTATIMEREARKQDLLSKIYLGFPKDSAVKGE